jgi:hypothetical protein
MHFDAVDCDDIHSKTEISLTSNDTHVFTCLVLPARYKERWIKLPLKDVCFYTI